MDAAADVNAGPAASCPSAKIGDGTRDPYCVIII